MAARVFIQFCIVIVLLTIDSSAASRFKKRIEERVNVLEVRFDAETRFRREDMSNLMDKMESVSAMFNLSAEHVTCPQQKGIRDENPSKSSPIREVSKLWRHDFMQITKAFKDEKRLNVKIRDQFSNIVDKTRNVEETVSRVDKTLDKVSNEINTVATDTKTVLNETTVNQIKLTELVHDTTELKQELSRVNETLDNVSDDMKTVVSETKTVLDETTANQIKLTELVHDTTELKQELGKVDETLDNVSDDMKTVVSETKTVLDETTANQIKLTELVHDTTELKQELGRVSNEINTVATDTKTVLDETTANQIKLTELVHDTTGVKQEMGKVDKTLDNVSEDMKITATDIKTVLQNQIKLTKLVHVTTELKQELGRVDTTLDNVSNEINTVATDTKAVLNETTANQIKLTELVHDTTGVKQEMGKVDKTLDNVSEDMKITATDIKTVLQNQIKLTELVHVTTELKQELGRVDTTLDTVSGDMNTIATDIKTMLQNQIQLVHEMTELKQELLIVKQSTSTCRRPRSCKELYEKGHCVSGLYDVYPDGTPDSIRVFCDQETDGGGWTVFQRREDGSEDFYRGWGEYENGFGDLDGEFWLGNKYLSILTAACCHRLRIDLGDFEGENKYAIYDEFQIGSKDEKYSLKVGRYSGNAGDSLSYHNGMRFSTKDQDNDKASYNCAVHRKGAWWYNNCAHSNLNGQYLGGKRSLHANGIIWYHWHGTYYSLKFTEMKFR